MPSVRSLLFAVCFEVPFHVAVSILRRIAGPDNEPRWRPVESVVTYHELAAQLFRLGWKPIDRDPEWIEYASPVGPVSLGWYASAPRTVFMFDDGFRPSATPLEPAAAARFAYLLTGT